MSFAKKLGAALLLGVAVQSPVWAEEPNVVRIVTHSPLSGSQSLLGEAIKFGAQLAVVGHYNSSVAIPASEIYSKVGLTMISPANNAAQITDRTSTRAVVNRLCGRDECRRGLAQVRDEGRDVLRQRRAGLATDHRHQLGGGDGRGTHL